MGYAYILPISPSSRAIQTWAIFGYAVFLLIISPGGDFRLGCEVLD